MSGPLKRIAAAFARSSARRDLRIRMVFVLFVLGVAACGSNEGGSSGTLELLRGALSSLDQQRDAAEDAIAECMRSEGFEYERSTLSAASSPAIRFDVPSEIPIFLAGRDSWKDSGYGYVNLRMYFILATAHLDDVFDQGPEFVAALYGTPRSPNPGCLARAYEEHTNLGEVDLLLEEIEEGLARARATVEQSSQLALWERCMADQGYSVNGLDGPNILLEEVLDRVLAGHDDVFDDVDFEFDATSGRYHVGSVEAAELVNEVYAFERELAGVDYDCSSDLYAVAQDALGSELDLGGP